MILVKSMLKSPSLEKTDRFKNEDPKIAEEAVEEVEVEEEVEVDEAVEEEDGEEDQDLLQVITTMLPDLPTTTTTPITLPDLPTTTPPDLLLQDNREILAVDDDSEEAEAVEQVDQRLMINPEDPGKDVREEDLTVPIAILPIEPPLQQHFLWPIFPLPLKTMDSLNCSRIRKLLRPMS